MLKEYDKLLEITKDDKIELASSFKNLLHTHLVIGQTRHTCRYGTLSDGHEKILPSQRYYQAIKEMWSLHGNISLCKVAAKASQADYLEAKYKLEHSLHDWEKLRYESQMEQAQIQILNALTTVEDQMRMLDEYNKVRLELMPEVEAKYPLGIEQAEPDNWKAVAEYRMIKEKVSGMTRERLDNIPMHPLVKAKLGAHYERLDAVAPLMVAEPERFKQLEDSNVKHS